MNKKNKNISEKSQKYLGFNNLSFVTIISSAFISLVVGIIACLLVLPYFVDSFGSDVKVSDYNWSDSGLIIRNPKTVVVNQDVKVEESINSVSASIIKFYPRLNASSTETIDQKLDSEKYYLLKNFFASGVIMSADGWVLTVWPNSGEIDLKKIASSYEALSADGKVYNIDQAIFASKAENGKTKAEYLPLLIHLAGASNLPVRSLAKPADLKIGQSLFSYNGGHYFDFGFLADRQKENILRSSEDFSENLVLDLGVDNSKQPNFIFNLSGDLLAWQSSGEEVSPIYPLSSRISSLFKLKKISEPYFGVNYYNLADIKIPGFNQDKGALIYSAGKKAGIISGSPAQKAGLKDGDLILEINGEAITGANDLSSIIQNYFPGQELLVSYSRSGVNAETSLKLGEIK
ncbi:MAG: S1C family serine protease [Patescibacteria group bacterium]|nr:S1C family serine protease [Patescibacteria group bacterium]